MVGLQFLLLSFIEIVSRPCNWNIWIVEGGNGYGFLTFTVSKHNYTGVNAIEQSATYVPAQLQAQGKMKFIVGWLFKK
jgi:hypothetical protein